MPTRERLGEIVTGGPPRGDRPIAAAIDNLAKTYPVPFLRLKKLLRRKFKTPVEALRDTSFNVHEGEIFGLIGPNGAGKTTRKKIIAGFYSAGANGHSARVPGGAASLLFMGFRPRRA